MKVSMKNPKTGEIKEIKVGWSWTLFFFSGFFGLPLFLRKLHVWGSIFLSLWVLNMIMGAALAPEQALVYSILFMFIQIGLAIFIGIKGNEMTAKNHLENNWVFIDPNSEITKLAKMRWGISAEHTA